MAKKLIYNYDFIPGAAGAGVVKFHGRHPQRVLLLITNVTRSTIIYNFAGAGFGGTISYDEADDLTTLTLESDTSTHNTNDELQIFLDIREDKVDFSETFVDPVSKLRVSEPQNLIDTDFEYGLQPTKWETVELVNNIPSFFASNESYSIGDVISVITISDSKVVTVTTLEPHGLTVGSPFEIQGLGQKTAEGKYLVTAVQSTTSFSYNAKKKQTANADISGSYTVVTPGQFYESSDIKSSGGVETSAQTRSTLTVSTDYTHGFEVGSSVYLTNTLGNEAYSVESGSATAADGRPYIDSVATITGTIDLDESEIVTRQMNSTYFYEFKVSSVDANANTITWENHNLKAGDCLLYLCPPYDTAIGGLERQQIYYVKTATTNTITLCETTNGAYTTNSAISFSSTGTSNFGKHSLHLCYEIRRMNKSYQNYYQYAYSRYRETGSGSGWDLSNGVGSPGLGGKYPNRTLFINKNSSYNWLNGWQYYPHYAAYVDPDFTLGKTTAGIVNDSEFMENFDRFRDYSSSYGLNYHYGGEFRWYNANAVYYASTNATVNYGELFLILLDFNVEADTFFVENHGLLPGDVVTLTTQSGQDIEYITRTTYNYTHDGSLTSVPSGSSSTVNVVDSNRFKLLDFVYGNNDQKMAHIRGQYQLTGTFNNNYKDTVFVGTNNLSQNQKLSISTTSTFPTTATGIIQPSPNTIVNVYDAIDTWAQAKVVTTDNAGSKGSLLFNSVDTYRPFTSINNALPEGRQYIFLDQYRYSTTYWYTNTMGYHGSWSHGHGPFPPDTVYPTPHDVHSGIVVFRGLGMYYLTTQRVYNTTTDYWINVFQVPDWSPYNANYVNSRIDMQRNSQFYGGNSYYKHATYNYNYSNWRTTAGGWRWAYAYNYILPNATYQGYLTVSLVLENTNWPTVNTGQSGNLYISFSGTNLLGDFDSFISGQRYMCDVIIPQAAGGSTLFATSSRTDAEVIVDDLANSIISTLSYPTFSSPTTTVYADKFDNNRIKFLQSPGGEYFRFTNAGADLSLETELIRGGVDGEYTITHTGAEEFSTIAPYKINGRTLSVLSSNVANSEFTSTGHKLASGTKVTYSGTTVPELTDGTDYYVFVESPDRFKLATDYTNAINGITITFTTPTSGTTFTVNSISARQEGDGTVTIVSGDRKITGTDTTFTQYFKPGDIFVVKNSSGNFDQYTVSVVTDDTELYTDESPASGITNTSYYIDTKIHVKPDGSSQHRPFDGGVEINAGSSPNSSIVRQTRKYFRYQSGKGIQCSLAINFNPSRLIQTITGVSSSVLATKTKEVIISNIGTSVYNAYGEDRYGTVIGDNKNISVIKGDTLRLIVSASGHPTYIQSTARGSGTGATNVVTTGVTNNGTDNGIIIWDTTNITAGTYYYQCSNHHTMVGQIIIEDTAAASSLVTVTTGEPHGLNRGNTVTISGSDDTEYNGTFDIVDSDDFQFVYDCKVNGSARNLTTGSPRGLMNYNPGNYGNTALRCGLFDYQNGFFFEYDGQDLYAVRRSSVQQISGRGSVTSGSNIVSGVGTSFNKQVSAGDMIVIRGSSYRVTAVESDVALHIQPAYKGINSTDAVITKTIDTKIAQSDWNIDNADGNGPSGFNLDITKIQMAYLDYSWYGAGKIRFGFKDTHGHVKYMHEFIHNNRLDEAYMRSGNIPARYEIENTGGEVGFIPALFHWGTSVIMDGKFDDDKAYLFTAASNDLTFTNGDSAQITTVADASLYVTYNYTARRYYWYSKIPFATADASNFTVGVELYTAGGELNGEKIAFTDYSGGNFNVYIYVSDTRRYTPPAIYPAPVSGTAVSIGAPASGSVDVVDLTQDIPLISIRLAPSVDNNLTGALGARDIINRMQLQLKQLGITVTHDCNVDLILNGSISTRSFEQVQSPSLSELVRHESGDRIFGGTKVFSLRASGGQGNVTSITEDFDLSQITDLGNSILGGDGVFPNGPDMLTIALIPKDTSLINATTPLKVSSRITWTESQA